MTTPDQKSLSPRVLGRARPPATAAPSTPASSPTATPTDGLGRRPRLPGGVGGRRVRRPARRRPPARVLPNVEHEQGIGGVVGHGVALGRSPTACTGRSRSWTTRTATRRSSSIQRGRPGHRLARGATRRRRVRTADGVVRRVKAHLTHRRVVPRPGVPGRRPCSPSARRQSSTKTCYRSNHGPRARRTLPTARDRTTAAIPGAPRRERTPPRRRAPPGDGTRQTVPAATSEETG